MKNIEKCLPATTYLWIFQFILRFDHPLIITWQGTCGLEIAEQVQDINAVVIPVGGGGLLAGCALALKTLHPDIKIIVWELMFEILQKQYSAWDMT